MSLHQKVIGRLPKEVAKEVRVIDAQLVKDCDVISKFLRGTWKFKGKNSINESVWENADGWDSLAKVTSNGSVLLISSGNLKKEFSVV